MSECCKTLSEASVLRERINLCGENVNKLVNLLEKDDKFPDL